MPKKVAVVFNQPDTGGRYQGEEKAILGVLDEVNAVHKALRELGYQVSLVPLLPPLSAARIKAASLRVDVVFNLFEGFAEDAHTEAEFAAILEELKIPFTGCPSRCLALALDKSRAKALFLSAGIPTPRYQHLSPESVSSFNLYFPCIVKPVAEDASHGLSDASIVRDIAALKKQVELISRLFGGSALVEEYIEGREFNEAVVGGDNPAALPPAEIIFELPPGKPKILTYAAKWETESNEYKGTKGVCPADLSPEQTAEISRIAIDAFRLLGCRGYGRVDMRMDERGRIYVIEVNPNPDISPGAGVARQVLASGMTYNGFIERVVGIAGG